ncbi:acyl carrier protein [Streptomyces sp. 4F14]|uniref:acyl carrier protein n=1 Tax=Streptomyces sp. 4F14 TaxID=3394380 RepID=UPI003A8A384A
MTTYTALAKILVDEIKVPADLVSPDASFQELELDSLALVELSVLIERELGVEIPEDELQDVSSLSGLTRLVERRTAGIQA